jgi:hypothetical protein
MKLLLVLDSDESYNLISLYVKPLGFELIRYRHAVKAMDNIDEIDPRAIVISARDFPRHWKTMVQFFRSERSRDECPVIVLTGEDFTVEERAKASFLGVSGTILESLDSPAEIERFHGIISRYLPVEEKRRSRRFHVEPYHRFGFVFARPPGGILATGEIKDISCGGLSFRLDNPALIKDMRLNTELKECSLRVGDAFLDPVCRFARTGRIISLEFLSFPKGEEAALSMYLDSLPLMLIKDYKEGKIQKTLI